MKQIFVLLVIFIFTSCSSSVRIKMTRAPEIMLPGVKTLKVDKVRTNGTLDLDMVNTGGGIMGVVGDIAVNAGSNALLVNKKMRRHLGERAQRGISSAISHDGYYQIARRGVDAHLEAKVFFEVNDRFRKESRKDRKGNSYYVQELHRKAQVKVQFSVVDSKGKILGSSTVSQGASRTAEHRSKNGARKNIINWQDLVHIALDNTYPLIVKKIAPYYVWERRVFAEAESKAIESGIEMATKGDWSGAESQWDQETGNGNKEVSGAAFYNKAIAAEVRGDLPEAIRLYERARDVSGNTDYSRAVTRAKNNLAEQERVRAASQAQTTPVSIDTNDEEAEEKPSSRSLEAPEETKEESKSIFGKRQETPKEEESSKSRSMNE